MDGVIFMAGAATCALVLIPGMLIATYLDDKAEKRKRQAKINGFYKELARLEHEVKRLRSPGG